MFAFFGFCFVFWLLISPGWRLYRLTRQDRLQVPLLEEGGRVQINKWLVWWFAGSLLASTCWIWFFMTSIHYDKVADEARVPWLWPHADLYLNSVIHLGLLSNSVWLVWLGLLDYKTTLQCTGTCAGVVTVVICTSFGFCLNADASVRFHILGSSAAGLAFIANICRIKSVEVRDSSLFALSVALAGTAPEILWMLNVGFVEYGTVFTAGTKRKIAFWDIFFKRNLHWKVSWTLNFLLRLPELVLLIRWMFEEKIDLCQFWNDRVLAPAENLFRKNGQRSSAEG